jgi:hypothetical protein
MHPSGYAATLFFVALVLSGCRTPAPAPLDFRAPGWRLHQGQAVWTMPGDRPEIAGELLVATHPDERAVVQFSKTPFPLVEARLEGARWSIEFIPEQKAFSGSGAPPARLGWLQLARSLSGATPSEPWEFERDEEGQWILRNSKTGEAIEGYLDPQSIRQKPEQP